jgi:hypothetical protein
MESKMKEQTAVEWLEKEFNKLEATVGVYGIMYSLIDQAKEMEKNQIIDSFDEARTYVLKNVWKHDDGKRYYQETYGK